MPRLMGWSGSPSTWTTCGVTFFALSPMVWMMTPQLTEQYGQVLRVSVVREIFSSLGLRVERLCIEAECGKADDSGQSCLNKRTSRDVHDMDLHTPNWLSLPSETRRQERA